jgi:hypothetical protein
MTRRIRDFRGGESMSSAQRPAALMLAVMMVGGCASFGDVSQLKQAPWPPPPAGARKTATVTYGGGVFSEKGENRRRHYVAAGAMCRTVDEIGTVMCGKQVGVPPGLLKAFQDSGFFSEIKTDGSPADVHVTVKSIVRNQENPGGAVLVGLTLFVAPGKIMDHFLVTRMTFKNREGKVLGKFEGKATGAQWWGLLSVFGLPFRDMAFEETEDVAYRSILIEAHEKGII